MSKKSKIESLGHPQPVLRKPPLWAFGILLLITLAAVEGMGRIVYQKKYTRIEDLQYRALMGLGSYFDPNSVSFYRPHHYLVYVPNPGSVVKVNDWFGERTQPYINSLGYRGPETTIEKPKGVYRIVCMGGSTTFGLTEPREDHTYPQWLQKLLNENIPSQRFEVINAGVPGWSSAESSISLHARLLELKPDMTVSYEGVNDTFAMRNPEEGKSDYSNFRYIVRFEFPAPWMRAILSRSAAVRLLYIAISDMTLDINSRAVKRAPPDFDQMAQLNGATGKYFLKNMRVTVDIAKGEGLVPVLVTMGHSPRWHPSIRLCAQINRDVAKEKGALLADFEKVALPEHFTDDGIHLQPSGNEALARCVFDTLVREGPAVFRAKSPAFNKGASGFSMGINPAPRNGNRSMF
jgi:lysophospholipase L1-like esterase